MDNEIKILFTSDVHLGIDEDSSPIPGIVRLNTFRRMTELAADHDILLIAGDLIDNTGIDTGTRQIIADEFRNLREKGTEILYTPGRGELTAEKSVADFLSSFHASHIFSNPAESGPRMYTKNDQTLYIYGMPAATDTDISDIRKASDDGFHIGLFHADINYQAGEPSRDVCTLQKEDIRTLGLDFYAFGYSHNFRMFKVSDRIIGAYPGTPEATGFQETGDRFALSITVKDNEILHIKRLTVNAIRILNVPVDCSSESSFSILERIMEDNTSHRTLLVMELTGRRDFLIDSDMVNRHRKSYHDIIIIDRSIPSLDFLLHEHGQENTLRGEFYSLLSEKLSQDASIDSAQRARLTAILQIITDRDSRTLEEKLCSLLDA